MPDRKSQQPSEPRASHLRVVDLRDPSGTLGRLEAAPERLRVAFSPLADLGRGVVAGYEVLVAAPGDEPAPPRAWADDVHPDSAGRLESVLLRRALAERDRLPANTFLLVTVSSAGLRSEEVQQVVRDAGRLERVVLVVGDDTEAGEPRNVRQVLDAMREAGGTVALDEPGSGYASLRAVLSVRPDFVRVGGDFVLEVDRDQAKAAVVETLGALASRIDAWLIAGGISAPAELGALRRIGVPLGQGPLIGPPMDLMGPLAPAVTDAIRQASPPADAAETVAALVEARPALPWGGLLEDIADVFLEDPRADVVVLVDARNRPLALAERAALLRGEPYERPVMRVTPSSPLKAVARRAMTRPVLERFHPLVACDPRGVYLGVVRVEQLLDTLARD
jgi:EAL domain-containing protein (putative c-di-GMP-specific phosphodiesterase class I)